MGEIADMMIQQMEDADFDVFVDPQFAKRVHVKGKQAKGYSRMHETANGKTIPISMMDNRHIENFINLVVERMNGIKQSALYEVGDTQDMFYRELNGVQKMSRKDAVEFIASLMYKLEPYLTELVIRGNNSYILNISKRLEDILGRTKITGKNLLK